MAELLEKVRDELGQPGEENQFYLKAERKHHVDSGEAAIYINHSVAELSAALGSSVRWCEILPLHMNVKACTYAASGDSLTLYLGRKFYQDPDDAYQEVWEKVFRALPRFKPGKRARLSTWIGTITHRHLVDRHRRRQVRAMPPGQPLVMDRFLTR